VGDVDDGCCVCAGCSSAGSFGVCCEVFCEALGFGFFLGVSECFGCDVRVFLEVGVVDVFFFEEVFVASADGYFAGSEEFADVLLRGFQRAVWVEDWVVVEDVVLCGDFLVGEFEFALDLPGELAECGGVEAFFDVEGFLVECVCEVFCGDGCCCLLCGEFGAGGECDVVSAVVVEFGCEVVESAGAVEDLLGFLQ